MKRIKEKIKKEIEISKRKKISKRRILILFAIIFLFLIILMILWGGVIHKNTGITPKDFDIQISE